VYIIARFLTEDELGPILHTDMMALMIIQIVVQYECLPEKWSWDYENNIIQNKRIVVAVGESKDAKSPCHGFSLNIVNKFDTRSNAPHILEFGSQVALLTNSLASSRRPARPRRSIMQA